MRLVRNQIVHTGGEAKLIGPLSNIKANRVIVPYALTINRSC